MIETAEEALPFNSIVNYGKKLSAQKLVQKIFGNRFSNNESQNSNYHYNNNNNDNDNFHYYDNNNNNAVGKNKL